VTSPTEKLLHALLRPKRKLSANLDRVPPGMRGGTATGASVYVNKWVLPAGKIVEHSWRSMDGLHHPADVAKRRQQWTSVPCRDVNLVDIAVGC